MLGALQLRDEIDAAASGKTAFSLIRSCSGRLSQQTCCLSSAALNPCIPQGRQTTQMKATEATRQKRQVHLGASARRSGKVPRGGRDEVDLAEHVPGLPITGSSRAFHRAPALRRCVVAFLPVSGKRQSLVGEPARDGSAGHLVFVQQLCRRARK